MKFDKIKTLKVLEFNILCCLMLMVSSKNLLHIDTPDCANKTAKIMCVHVNSDTESSPHISPEVQANIHFVNG